MPAGPEHRQKGGQKYEKAVLAGAAVIGAAGALLVGRYFQPEALPIDAGPAPAAESVLYISSKQRLLRIKNTIQGMHDNGADNTWVENKLYKGTRRNVYKKVYMVGLQPKNQIGKKTFDQIALFVDEGEATPSRLLIVQGVGKPKYKENNQTWKSWMEIDEIGEGQYAGMGNIDGQPVNRTTTYRNLPEIILDAADIMLGLPEANTDNRNLIA